MRTLKLLGLMLTTALVAAIAIASSASALNLPENLPESTTRTWTGANVGPTTLRAEGQSPVECTGATGEGTETSSKPPLGLFHIHFSNCTAKVGGISVKCTGLGEGTGVILVLGTWHLVWDREKGGSFALTQSADLLLNEPAHFSCSILLEELRAGETLCLHLKPEESKATHEFHCFGKETSGKPEPTEEWCAADPCVTPITPSLTAKINMGTTAVPTVLEGLGTVTALQGGAEVAINADQ